MSNSEEPIEIRGTQDGQYLLASCSGVNFALPIMSVREIIEPLELTKVPLAPDWLLGLANLRGQVFPVIQLSRRMNLKPEENSVRPVLVVVDFLSENGVLPRGLLVDKLGGIIAAGADDIKPFDAAQAGIARQFIAGLLQITPQFAYLLNYAAVFDATNYGAESA